MKPQSTRSQVMGIRPLHCLPTSPVPFKPPAMSHKLAFKTHQDEEPINKHKPLLRSQATTHHFGNFPFIRMVHEAIVGKDGKKCKLKSPKMDPLQ